MTMIQTEHAGNMDTRTGWNPVYRGSVMTVFVKIMMSLIALLVLPGYLNAQVISGKITDQDGYPVEFATIALQTPDSVFISGTYSDSLGCFSFRNDITAYRLIIRHLMYGPYEAMHHLPDAGTIRLESMGNDLSEVVIQGERPMVRVIDNRMTYDMPQLLQGKVISNVYESLLQLPGVTEMNGGLTLAGASSLSVIIDGKPTTMSPEQLVELLKNTPKERVLKAEVMYSAPPQYHIRGAAINLILAGNDSQSPDLQGQVNMGYDQYHYADYHAGVTLLYSRPGLSADMMYSYQDMGNRSGLDLYSRHLYQDNFYGIEQHNRGKLRKSTHNIRLGNDLKLGNGKLDVTYTGQVTPDTYSENSSYGTYSESETTRDNTAPVQMHNMALGYTSGFGLRAGVDYTCYKNHSIQYYDEKTSGKEGAFNAWSDQDINRFTVYADQQHPMDKDWELNYGAKFMYASNKSSQTYQSLSGKDMSASNSSSDMREYTYNIYAGGGKSFSEKFSVSLSLTGAYYRYEYFDEWSLFPAMELTYVAGPAHIFQLSVSSDKTYPGYWEMMNSISYLDGYTEIHGTPDLRPCKDYDLQLSYILRNKYIFTAYANYQDDYFVQLPYQSPGKLSLIYKTLNFDYSAKAGLNIVIPFRIGSVMDSRLTLNGFYDRARCMHFHDTWFDNDNLAFYAGLNNTFHISSRPNIKAELSAACITRNIQGPSEFSGLYQADAGVKWTFAGDQAELRLKVNDIFNSWSPETWKMQLENQDLRMHVIPDLRYVSLSFTYKFGNFKEQKHKDVDTSRFGK